MTCYALPCSSTPCYAVLYHASRTLLRLQALEGRGDNDNDDDNHAITQSRRRPRRRRQRRRRAAAAGGGRAGSRRGGGSLRQGRRAPDGARARGGARRGAPRSAPRPAPRWARLGAVSPRDRQLGAWSYEDVSGETARTTSRAAARSPEFRGCLRRNGPDHLARGSSELRFRRMSQAKRPIPDNSETRVVRMSQAKRPGPPDFVEDVSALLSLGRS